MLQYIMIEAIKLNGKTVFQPSPSIDLHIEIKEHNTLSLIPTDYS